MLYLQNERIWHMTQMQRMSGWTTHKLYNYIMLIQCQYIYTLINTRMLSLNYMSLMLLALSLVSSIHSYPTFADYVVLYDKHYDAQEYAFREQVYNNAIAGFANVVNFIPGVNNMTDWTQEQFKNLLNLQQKPPQERVSTADPLAARLGAPVSLDWRTSNIITSIKNQGSCGACYTFASIAQLEAMMVKSLGKSIDLNLAQQFVFECSSNYGCAGGYLQNSLASLANGAPTQAKYVFRGRSYYGSQMCSDLQVKAKVQTKSYYSVTDSMLINLLQEGPVSVAVASAGWSSYSSGTITCSASATIDHAVLAIGYTADAIIIKNSWGTSWGMSGYAYVSRSSTYGCSIQDQVHAITVAQYSHNIWISLGMLVVLLTGMAIL